jgi:hypothetical protein
MGKLYRAQILLAAEQREALIEIARHTGMSVSGIVRDAVQDWLVEHGEEELIRHRLEDLEIIRAHRQAWLVRRGGKPLEIDVAGVIEQMRRERDDELIVGILGKAE